MDRVNGRIAQVYGYAVCLICVIIILVSTHSIIDAVFDYSNPAESGTAYGRPAVSSYETYRMEHRHAAPAAPGAQARPDSGISDAEMRKMYDADRAEILGSARYRALRSLVSNVIFLALATTLFLLHWRWIRRTNVEQVPG